MKLNITPGKYILAVSGGVDSIVLLHLLAQKAIVNSQQSTVNSQETENSKTRDYRLSTINSTSSIELVVAHFNHGIRPDSAEDEQLVKITAKRYDIPLEVGYGRLGVDASEEQARNARYDYLEAVKEKYGADSIVTAHHQDDLIETAFINILRGTGRTGLSSISNSKIYRPLLDVSKKDILSYAKKNKLQWREDETNTDTKYLRNYIRQNIMPELTVETRKQIVNNLDKVAKINKIIDIEIATLSHLHQINRLDRRIFLMLPNQIGWELLIKFLRQNGLEKFDEKSVKRLSTIIKTGKPGTEHEIVKGKKLKLTITSAELI